MQWSTPLPISTKYHRLITGTTIYVYRLSFQENQGKHKANNLLPAVHYFYLVLLWPSKSDEFWHEGISIWDTVRELHGGNYYVSMHDINK